MLDVYLSSSNTIWIAKQEKPIQLVRIVFDKLNDETVEYVLDCFRKTSLQRKIGNVKQYLLTALYNAPMTADAYYCAEANYDYGDETK